MHSYINFPFAESGDNETQNMKRHKKFLESLSKTQSVYCQPVEHSPKDTSLLRDSSKIDLLLKIFVYHGVKSLYPLLQYIRLVG